MFSRRALRSINLMSREMLKIKNPASSQMLINQHARYALQPYSNSNRAENQLIVGGIAIAGTAISLQYILQAYQKAKATTQDGETTTNNTEAESAQQKATAGAEATQDENTTASSSKAEAAQKERSDRKKAAAGNSTVNTMDSAFSAWFARNFYDGGFEEKMSKREAALILGIRESAPPEKVKEAHRRILMVNHPDRGGSAFIAAKINEAKDLLLKGKV
jgi:DnaJ homolog subfamily C member 19